MKNLYGESIKDLEEYFLSINEKKYKAIQVFEALYRSKVKNILDISNIKKTVRDDLNRDYFLGELKLLKEEKDLEVIKYLFELRDGQAIEAVLMKHDYGNSVCISTQVGCNMACSFCESGRTAKIRNLSTEEMVEQVLLVEEYLGERISHVVVMGIGEPFDNYDNLIKFIDIINHPKGLAIGARHITVSTCGIIPRIKDFSKLAYQVNLAISLHAPNDELRTKLMPINKAYPLKELMAALKEYQAKTNRRITFEYIMLEGINDSQEMALELVNLVKDLNCYINLIPYNETSHFTYKRTKNKAVMAFYDIIKKNKLNVTIRREFGTKISAACGQLRTKKEEL